MYICVSSKKNNRNSTGGLLPGKGQIVRTKVGPKIFMLLIFLNYFILRNSPSFIQ